MSKREFPNVAEVRQQARDEWEQRQKQRTSRIERISSWIDYWIIFFVLAFALLSIPHTVRVFDMITPTFGKPAFIGLEVGLLYRSFRGKMARTKGETLHVSLRLMGWLMFVVLIAANGAGSFIAIAEQQQAIEGLSLAQLWATWPHLDATAQIALLLVPLAAIMIPVGTIVGGEGLAALFLEVQQEGDPLDELWQEVAQDVEFLALRDAAIDLGHTPKSANKWARDVVEIPAETVRLSGQTKPDTDKTGHAPNNSAQKRTKRIKRADILAILDEQGEPDVTVREFAAEIGAAPSTTHEALQVWRASHNGHGNSATAQEE